jgi:hypothetical protein
VFSVGLKVPVRNVVALAKHADVDEQVERAKNPFSAVSAASQVVVVYVHEIHPAHARNPPLQDVCLPQLSWDEHLVA